jgi:hypothetical protein
MMFAIEGERHGRRALEYPKGAQDPFIPYGGFSKPAGAQDNVRKRRGDTALGREWAFHVLGDHFRPGSRADVSDRARLPL